MASPHLSRTPLDLPPEPSRSSPAAGVLRQPGRWTRGDAVTPEARAFATQCEEIAGTNGVTYNWCAEHFGVGQGTARTLLTTGPGTGTDLRRAGVWGKLTNPPSKRRGMRNACIDHTRWERDVAVERARERVERDERFAAGQNAAEAERSALSVAPGGRALGAPWPRAESSLLWGIVEPRDVDPLAWDAWDGVELGRHFDAVADDPHGSFPEEVVARLTRLEDYCGREADSRHRVRHRCRVAAMHGLATGLHYWRSEPSAADDEEDSSEVNNQTLQLRVSRRPWLLARETLATVRALAVHPAGIYRPVETLLGTAVEPSGRPSEIGTGLLRALYALWRSVRPWSVADVSGDVLARAAWIFAWACVPQDSTLAAETLRDVIGAYVGPLADERRETWWADARTRRAFSAGMVWALWPVAPRAEDLAPADAGKGVFTWDTLPPDEIRHALTTSRAVTPASVLLGSTASARAGTLAGATLVDVFANGLAEHHAWAALAATLPPRVVLQRVVYGTPYDPADV